MGFEYAPGSPSSGIKCLDYSQINEVNEELIMHESIRLKNEKVKSKLQSLVPMVNKKGTILKKWFLIFRFDLLQLKIPIICFLFTNIHCWCYM